MFINIGAMIAPFLATYVRDVFVEMQGFGYNSDLPGLCHQFLNGEMSQDVLNGRFFTAFANDYLSAFNTGFHYAFSVAIIAMLISLVVFVVFKKLFPNPTAVANTNDEATATISKEEIKQDAQEICYNFKRRNQARCTRNQASFDGTFCCIWYCYFLLVLFPSKWFDAYNVCERLYFLRWKFI